MSDNIAHLPELGGILKRQFPLEPNDEPSEAEVHIIRVVRFCKRERSLTQSSRGILTQIVGQLRIDNQEKIPQLIQLNLDLRLILLEVGMLEENTSKRSKIEREIEVTGGKTYHFLHESHEAPECVHFILHDKEKRRTEV